MILALGIALVACGGQSKERRVPPAGVAATSGVPGAGNGGASGSGHGGVSSGGHSSILLIGASGSAGGGRGGSPSVALGPPDDGEGGANPDSMCDAGWGTPASDPGYRGLRGTLNGQALNVEGDSVKAWVSFCAKVGPGPTPNLSVYFPLNDMSFWFYDTCKAKVTSPKDTEWHGLEIRLSAAVTPWRLAADGVTFEPVSSDDVVSGHVTLQGQSPDGPLSLDADLYLDVTVKDPCVLPVD